MTRPTPDKVERVACVGGGTIGAGWAAGYLAASKDVMMSDPAPDAEAKARVIINQAWPYLKRLGLAEGASLSRFSFTTSVEEAVAEAHFVQESAPDSLAVVVSLARETLGQHLCPCLDERAVHQIKRLDGHVRRLTVASNQARLGEIEQVENVGEPVADDGEVDRTAFRPVEVLRQPGIETDQ